jgi:hypothetical protein
LKGSVMATLVWGVVGIALWDVAIR